MSEDKIINKAKSEIDYYTKEKDEFKDFNPVVQDCQNTIDLLQGLLDLYKQEKEKNKKLKQEYEELDENFTLVIIGKERIEKENGELKAELKQEKEERQKFEKAFKQRMEYSHELEKDLFENCSNYVISKDKIKEKIEELRKIHKERDFTNKEGFYLDCYKELLEEE